MMPDRQVLDAIRDERAEAVGARNWTYDEADAFYREGWDDAIAYVAGERLEPIEDAPAVQWVKTE